MADGLSFLSLVLLKIGLAVSRFAHYFCEQTVKQLQADSGRHNNKLNTIKLDFFLSSLAVWFHANLIRIKFAFVFTSCYY